MIEQDSSGGRVGKTKALANYFSGNSYLIISFFIFFHTSLLVFFFFIKFVSVFLRQLHLYARFSYRTLFYRLYLKPAPFTHNHFLSQFT